MATKYSKKFENLSAAELKCIASVAGYDPIKFASLAKPVLIDMIAEKDEKFDTLEYCDKLYYFSEETDEETGQAKVSKIATAEAEKISTDYPEKFASINRRNVYAEYRNPKGGDDDDKSNVTDTDNSSVKRDSNQPTYNRIPRINYKITLKFDESRGIESFLSNVESYVAAHNVKDQSEKIKIALAVLDSTEYGLYVKESLTSDEMNVWSSFRTRLISLMGKSKQYYLTQFRTFKRKADESAGMCMARLLFVYKKAFKPVSSQLNDTDKEHLKSTFILALDKTLATLVSAEEHLHSYETIAERADQLERSYNLQGLPINSVHLNAIHEAKPPVAKHDSTDVSAALLTLTEQVTQLAKELRTLKSSSRKTDRRPARFPTYTPKLLPSDFQGYCIAYVLDGICNKERNCNFKHGDQMSMPENIKALKSKYTKN